MTLAAAGNKTLALERKKKPCVLKKTDLRFICFFAYTKTSHILCNLKLVTTLTNRKLYDLTSVIYLYTIDNRHTSCPRNFANVNAT